MLITQYDRLDTLLTDWASLVTSDPSSLMNAVETEKVRAAVNFGLFVDWYQVLTHLANKALWLSF